MDGYRWAELADYNARVAKGIVHTPEFAERMRVEQEAFDREHELHCVVCGHIAEYTLASGDGARRVSSCKDCLDLVRAVEWAR